MNIPLVYPCRVNPIVHPGPIYDAHMDEKMRKKPKLLPATENSSKFPFFLVKIINPK